MSTNTSERIWWWLHVEFNFWCVVSASRYSTMDNALNKQHQKLFLCNLACFFAFLFFFFFSGFFGILLQNSMHHVCGFLRLLYISCCVCCISFFFHFFFSFACAGNWALLVWTFLMCLVSCGWLAIFFCLFVCLRYISIHIFHKF